MMTASKEQHAFLNSSGKGFGFLTMRKMVIMCLLHYRAIRGRGRRFFRLKGS